MRRTALRQSDVPLVRRARIRPYNRERAAKLRARQFGPEAEWMRALPCATCAHPPPSEPSHVKSRGSGGTRPHLVPQCPVCHQGLHDLGTATFQARRPGCDLAALAEEYAMRWEALPAAERDHYGRLFRERWPDAARYLDRTAGARHGRREGV